MADLKPLDFPLLTAPTFEAVLRRPSLDVTANDDVQDIVTHMLNSLYDAGGVGASAVQFGVHKRIIVLDFAWWERAGDKHVIINPEVLTVSSEQRIYREACLSIPYTLENKANKIPILGPRATRLRYLTLGGERLETWFIDNNVDETSANADSHLIQHELRHLAGGKGALITDFLPNQNDSLRAAG